MRSTSMSQSNEIRLTNIDLDEMDRQNAVEEANLQAEITAIKQEFVEKHGKPVPLAEVPVEKAA